MKCVLVDARNIIELSEELFKKFSVENQLNGFDIETEDSRRHAGLNRAMVVSEDGHKGATKKLLFDVNRTVVTGFSLYADKDDTTYYFNLAHADVENRIPFEVVRPLLEQAKATGYFVAHKSPYELTMMLKSLGFDLGEKIFCTLQLAVTCFNADTYPIEKFLQPGLGEGFKRLLPTINKLYQNVDPKDLSNEQEELLLKFIAKESDAEHSWNGYVKSIRYGYGLKGLTEYFLGYKQVTFAEVMKDKAHMGQLTGQEVVSYGADDAWTCTHLFHKLMDFLIKTNPAGVDTYFNQENPMCQVYSEVWREGVVVSKEKILEGQAYERKNAAELLRGMKKAVKAMLPFPPDVHEKLVKYDSKYKPEKYRAQVIKWANTPDSDDDYTQLMQCKTSLSVEWGESRGEKPVEFSITYYLVVRCLMYDLGRMSFQLLDGKVQSDAEAQDRCITRWMKAKGYNGKPEDCSDPQVQLMLGYKKLSSTNQAVKLYINKYLNLIDPDTNRMYPILSSQLNSRRMALEDPNTSQLAKNSGIAYVRSYFEPDAENHVIVSADWSGVELVLIGDQSGDPEFAKAFGQLPHIEMHTPTVLNLMQITMEEYMGYDAEKRKRLRTDVGKGGNFNYWYSGALGTVARELNLPSEEMWTMVERYRNLYTVAEQWRVGVINEARIDGKVTLPDGNVRYRFESTPMWAEYMRAKFAQFGEAASNFGEIAIRKIQSRSGNQSVNSKIQGTCATLAKRSLLRTRSKLTASILKNNFDTAEKVAGKFRARHMFPVHDELVYSVHRDDAVEFSEALYEAMCDHPDIVKTMKLDAAMAVGRNYLGWHEKKNPKGQVELDEASSVPCLPEERWKQKLTREERQKCVDYLFT